MRGPHFDSKTAGPNDSTIDAPSPVGESKGSKGSGVRFADDSSKDLKSEINLVLRRRVRITATMMSIAFSAFLIWHAGTFVVTADQSGWPLITVHLLVTAALIACSVFLYERRDLSTAMLRGQEICIFALAAAFLMFWYYDYIAWNSRTYRFVPDIEGTWLMLIFVYALFIPNNWQRAAIAIGVLALLPLTLTVLMANFHPDCQLADNLTLTFYSQLALKMIIAAVTAIVAVQTINTLRREVYEARQLGQYKLVAKIGAGGMGEVFLAEHQMMKRPCAIKMIRPEKAGDPKTLARFEQEVQTIAQLSHWNNIDIFDYGRADDGTFYYVMEFLPGLDLKQIVDKHGPMPPERVIFLLRQICDALNEAHGIGLIHRDIKPGNIIAADRGGLFDIAKLLDFGLARPSKEFESAARTDDGSVSGSPAYMSPEQVNNDDDSDERSDIYALGTVAYFLLTGRPPFDDINPVKVMMSHVDVSPQSVQELNANVPDDLSTVVMRCLEKKPNARFQSVMDLKQALEECRHAELWSFETAAKWWRSAGSSQTSEVFKTSEV